MRQVLLISMIILSMLACKTQQKSSENVNTDTTATQIAPKPFVAALPHVVIYKTTKDYRQNVPVILSEDKTQIVSYPHPSDLYYNGKLALPETLHNGYLLDNRGIGKNVAFLKYTYKEYSKFTDVPTLDELFKNIIDNDPLTELWDCGKKVNFTDLQKQLNEMIDKNQLAEKCKRVK
ncbi:MAG TPA: hypothetical protein PLF32_07700 [Bacteroidales bacterium]|nr:hypothetical protein [Bacteroidales bacterium]HOR82525.1 hypothetical protein [Bacteroidales bacterium]HPJ91259.1 hypothetical protein [Bacteroidales bacterium]